MIKAERVKHRGKNQIKLVFGFDNEIKAAVKSLEGAAWSKTHNAWLVPEGEQVIESLKVLFPAMGWVGESDKPKKLEDIKVIADKNNLKDRNKIKVEVIGKKILLKMPKNQADIVFVRTLKYSRWISDNYF